MYSDTGNTTWSCKVCSGTGLKKLDLNLVEYKQPFPKAVD